MRAKMSALFVTQKCILLGFFNLVTDHQLDETAITTNRL